MAKVEGFPCSSERHCFFCKKAIAPGEPHRYIYPVPVANTPRSVGAIACLTCAPEAEAKQVEMGLVLPVEATPIRATVYG